MEMKEARRVELSKFLSYLLRHQPEAAGLELEPGGWVLVSDLLAGARRVGRDVKRSDLEAVIAGGDKLRFRFSPEGDRFRANYGHSVEVDLGLNSEKPPDRLFHGTAQHFLESIRIGGLRPRGRGQVHLSVDRETAHDTGLRHGRAVVLEVLASRLAANGHPFYRPAEGIWLTPNVPPRYLQFPLD